VAACGSILQAPLRLHFKHLKGIRTRERWINGTENQVIRRGQFLSIRVYLHKTHRQYVDDLESVTVTGDTVGECLQDLIRRYPRLAPKLFDGSDKLLTTVEVYLNMQSTYPEELAKPTQNGDEIHITLLLAGG
jgi:molybdopterin converting factor small subunit